MRYNAPDTIYYRQARSIQELAKKNFENLRQESDDNEPEPKPVRRGRPPSKNTLKKVGRPPAERAGSNFSSNATPANAGDSSHWIDFTHDLSRKRLDKTNLSELSTKSYGLRSTEAHSLIGEQKSERNEDNSGFAVKGASLKYPKKSFVVDENRRSTYSHPQLFGSTSELSVLTTFDGEQKQLVPVGLYIEHAYARSLARFAAKLGPIGWEIAARRIESVLPPGTNFGRGWVRDNEAPQQSQPPILTRSPSHSSQPENTPTTASASASENPENGMVVKVRANTTPQATSSDLPSRFIDPAEGTVRNQEGAFKLQNTVGGHGIWQKTPFCVENVSVPAVRPTLNGFNSPLGFSQLSQVAGVRPTLNGFNSPLGFSQLSQVGANVKTSILPESSSTEAMRMHYRAVDMIARNNIQKPMSHINMDKMNSAANPSTSSSSGSHLPDSGHDSQGTRWGLSPNPKSVPVPPDLNVGFQSPGSPVSQNPNLSLQL